MNSIRPKVYISYSSDDIDHDLLNYLIYFLNYVSESKYEILCDIYNNVGDDFQQFMETINEIDAVIILCTRRYKEKVLNREPSGVYSEFKFIIERYRQTKDEFIEEKERKYFDLLPILFSGTVETSIPNEITNLLAETLVGIYPARNREGKFIIPKDNKVNFGRKLENISARIKALHNIKKESFKDSWNELFKILFKDSKSDWHKPESRKYIDQVFVKTNAYKKIRDQNIWFLVGRKGSGKSTLTDIIPILQDERFDCTIRIEAEDVYLQIIYNLFSLSKGFDSDTKELLPRTKVFQFGWEGFICLITIYTLVKQELIENSTSKANLESFVIDILNDNLNDEFGTEINTFLSYSFIKLQEYINKSFSELRVDKLGADIASSFSIKKFIEYIIPKNIYECYIESLKHIEKGILLSFDGFDTVFDEFRKDSLLSGDVEEFQKRSNFEVNWLTSLILLILNQGVNSSVKNPVYKKFFYCITIPKDRFIEVRKRDRDTFRHFNKFADLNWSGIELSILLRKRMEELSGFYTNENKNVQERFEEVLTEAFPNIPLTIDLTFKSVNYKIPLFIYILRHTFWRPRDILFYFTGIFSLNRELIKKKNKISSEDIRIIVKKTTFKVIESEFLNEFETTIVNFRSIIQLFKNKSQILDYDTISELIGNYDFQRQTSLDSIESIFDKIHYLHDIGFLGFIVPEKIQNEYSISKYAFSFNERDYILDKIDNDDYFKLKYVIHPIFIEFLNLSIFQNDELVLNYSWDYLHKQELMNNIDI